MSDMIPSELVREILLRLPGKSLLRLRSSCKEWRRVIDDPSFIRSHTNIQLSSYTLLLRSGRGRRQFYLGSLESLNFTDRIQAMDTTPINCRELEQSSVLLPCNGLILLFFGWPFSWLIMNLLTRRCHELPRPPLVDDKNYHYSGGYGFVYDYAADDYKVVMIDSNLKTQIYSLKPDSWRVIGSCPYDCTGAGVFLNRALHWLSWDGDRDRIVVLNLGTEDYRLFPLPSTRRRAPLQLEALGGQLFCFDQGKTWHDCRYEGWVMKDYGVENSWRKVFSIELPESAAWIRARPVAYFRREKHLLLQYREGFYWVDIGSGSVKKVTVKGISRIGYAHLCTPNLLPLDVLIKTASGTD